MPSQMRAPRLAGSPAAKCCNVIKGDCNDRIDDIVALIPKGVLTLAFIDPPGLDAHHATLQKLAACGRVDMLILFPDPLDALGMLQDTPTSRIRGSTAYSEQNPARDKPERH